MNRKQRRAGGGSSGGKTAALIAAGIAAVERNDIAAAAPLLEQAAEADPKNPWALVGLAVVRMEQHDLAAALKLAEKAQRLDGPPEVLAKIGHLYKEAGQLERARQLLRQALIKKPGYVMGWFSMHTLKTFAPGDADLFALVTLAQSASLTPDDRIRLEFILGKAWLDAGDADKGFAHLEKGNALRRATYKYDITTFENYIDRVITLFDEATVKRLGGKGTATSDRPIFVVGMFRSGSTLVDQILASHPEATSIGEAKFFQQSLPIIPDAEDSGKTPVISQNFMAKLDAAMLGDIAQKYLAATEPFTKGAKRVVDKMLFNYLWTGIIRLALPNARIIHCVRDPADIGLSIWRTHFSANLPWAYDQTEIARYYHGYARLMAHWHKLFPGQIYDLSYEALVTDQRGETAKLLNYCGLPWDDRCLDFHKTERRVTTASEVQVRQPIYKDSVRKSAKYDKHLQPLLLTLKGA
jgi:tetratricopeptide (TPR) repeat protein